MVNKKRRIANSTIIWYNTTDKTRGFKIMELKMPRNDAEFNLDTVSNREIFDGLKASMFECLQAVEHLE